MALSMALLDSAWRCSRKVDRDAIDRRDHGPPSQSVIPAPQLAMPMIDISIISPVYGCEACLEALHHRISQTVGALGLTYEIVLVDDRGPDRSWLVISALARRDPAHVRAIRLSRNFGQHQAISAGLHECRGRVAVVLDCDLQEPPEVIATLYEKYQEGHQVVLARRLAGKHPPLKRAASWLFARLMRLLNGHSDSPRLGSLSLIGRPVIDQFNVFKDVNRHYLHIVQWLGFDPVTIDYVHQVREAGRSSYSFSKLLRHASQGVFFQSTRWLKAVVLTGVLISIFGLGVGCWAFWTAMHGTPPPGCASTLVIACVLGGAIIFVQGIVGLYVGQIFDQVKGRPLYVVAERVGAVDSAESLGPARGTE